MSSKASTTAIGGFVLGAITLFVGALLYFGSGHFGEEVLKCVLYFDGSLKGLNVGAPVLFRGVKIGEVKRIIVRYSPGDQELSIPVFVEVYPESVERADGSEGNHEKTLQLMIDKGMRAKLEMQSFVTGMLSISLGMYPDEKPRYVRAGHAEIEIPTLPSMMDEITRTLENLPIEELANGLKSAIQSIDELARSERLSKAIDSLDVTLGEFGELARKVNGQVDPLSASVEETLCEAREALRIAEAELPRVTGKLNPMLEEFTAVGKKINENIDPAKAKIEEVTSVLETALKQATATLQKTEVLVDDNGEMYYEIVTAIRELNAAARSIRLLADYIEQHPEALLHGKQMPGGNP